MTTNLSTPLEVLRLIDRAHLLAFDFETAGPVGKSMDGALEPRRGRVRLLSLSDGEMSLVMDCFEHDLRAVLPALHGRHLIIHNASFDLAWCWRYGLRDLPQTTCTYLLAQVLCAGEGERGFPPCGLAACCARYLNKPVDKKLQVSDWSGPLSSEQVEYSRRDAEVLIPLYTEMMRIAELAKLLQVVEIEMRALPAFVWMSQSGVQFDRQKWSALARGAAQRKRQITAEMNLIAPRRDTEPDLFDDSPQWNWASWQQVKEIFKRIGITLATTNDAALALLDGPLAARLRKHRHEAQLVKMYGPNWLNAADIVDGRLYPGWRQMGTATGRTSGAEPNCQQLPRDEQEVAPGVKRKVYRDCFGAASGRVLVKADYATLQMRIGCNHARDKALYDVFSDPAGDPHTATAKALTGKAEPSKLDRQLAKSLNFGLLFGMQVDGLRVYTNTEWGISLTEQEALKHRTRFFQVYNGLARWHAETRRRKVEATRGISGRRRLLPSYAPDTWRLNSPVQGDESDGLKSSMALLWERRRQCPGAFPVLVVHDEIVVDCAEGQAEQVKQWLTQAMVDGMTPWLKPVPVRVDAKVVQTWGE